MDRAKKKNSRPVDRKGFSLVEMIVAIFIFSLVMTTVTSIFVQAFNTRKKAKEIQTNIEDARYAMELMAKSLRMSSVKDSSTSSILIYDYSQRKCIEYERVGSSGKLRTRSSGILDNEDECDTRTPLSSGSNMNTGRIETFSIDATNSTGSSVGRVTIAMEICSNTSCTKKENIQTTVSLRDYGYIVSQ